MIIFDKEGRDHKKGNKVEEYADSICNSCEGKILEGKQSSPKTNKRTSIRKSQSYDAVDNVMVVVVHLLRYMMESCWRNTAKVKPSQERAYPVHSSNKRVVPGGQQWICGTEPCGHYHRIMVKARNLSRGAELI